VKTLVFLFTILAALPAFAGVAAYSGESGEKVFIEAAPSLGKEAYLLKFEGPDSPWAGKVIQVKRTATSGGDERFAFDYDLELSDGVHKRTYQIVTEGGYGLIEGSRVRQIKLFYQGTPRMPNGLKLSHDRKLTEASQKINLLAEHKKSPFKPDVD
jgi:hypothetical protein